MTPDKLATTQGGYAVMCSGGCAVAYIADVEKAVAVWLRHEHPAILIRPDAMYPGDVPVLVARAEDDQ